MATGRAQQDRPAPAARAGARRPVRDAALGSRRRIGLWILPLFVLVAALAAALAGGLAFLYYGQQVDELEGTTASARADLDGAVERVGTAATEATAAIDAQVRGLEESLAEQAPVTDPNAAGVYAVAADHDGGEVRVASAFTLFSDTRETYLATAYRVVADGAGGAVPSARLSVPGQGAVPVQVHNFDAALDVAVLVAPGGPLPVLPWRPAGEPLTPGVPVFLAAVAGEDTPVVLQGTLGGVGPRAVVTDVPLNAFLTGGPLTDAAGRVVAVSSTAYTPFGEAGGDLDYAVPVRLLCRRLLQCTPEDLGPEGLGEAAGAGTVPAEAAVPPAAAVEPPEAPTPVGTPEEATTDTATPVDPPEGAARIPSGPPDTDTEPDDDAGADDDAGGFPLQPVPAAPAAPSAAPGVAPPLPAPVPTGPVSEPG